MESIKTAFSDLGQPIKAKLRSTIESFFCDRGYATASHDVLITKVVTLSNSAFDQLKAHGATRKELCGFLYTKAVKIVLADTLSNNENDVSTRILLTIKEYKTDEERWKARIVVQGCMTPVHDHDGSRVASHRLRRGLRGTYVSSHTHYPRVSLWYAV